MKRRTFLHDIGTLAGGLAVVPAVGHAADQGAGQAPAAARLPNQADPGFWPAVRRQFQLPAGFAYLNTAGLGASPRAVADTLSAWTDREEANPAPGHNENDWARIRKACAGLLGPTCSDEEIAFVSTATEGINAILNTIPLTRGDEVITSTHEHASLAIALLHRMNTLGIAIRTFEPDLASAPGNVDRIASSGHAAHEVDLHQPRHVSRPASSCRQATSRRWPTRAASCSRSTARSRWRTCRSTSPPPARTTTRRAATSGCSARSGRACSTCAATSWRRRSRPSWARTRMR